eukprot:2666147-Amphidinium_carterae.1
MCRPHIVFATLLCFELSEAASHQLDWRDPGAHKPEVQGQKSAKQHLMWCIDKARTKQVAWFPVYTAFTRALCLMSSSKYEGTYLQ